MGEGAIALGLLNNLVGYKNNQGRLAILYGILIASPMSEVGIFLGLSILKRKIYLVLGCFAEFYRQALARP